MKRQFWQNKSRKILILTGIVAVLCLGIITAQAVRNHSLSTSKNANRMQTTTVDAMTVSRSDLIKRISLTGQTVPEAQVDIAAKYQGKVVQVAVNLGQRVSPGQVLIVQDTGDADISISENQAAYQQASADAVTTQASFGANYDKAKADYQRALNTYQRYKSLYDVGGISKEDLATSEQAMADAKAALDTLTNQMNASAVPAAVESARAAADKAQQSVQAAAKQRDDLVLRAPRSGVIGYRQVEVGDMVSAGQKLLSIYDNSKIYVDCQVSEQDLPALSVGMKVTVGIESLGKTIPGQIIYISPASDSSNLTYTLRILLSNPDQTVKSGMFTRTIINSVLRPDTIVVPKDAILEKNGQNYVFVINTQHVIEQRTVQVGARGDTNVEILSGLKEGEQVALTNLARLRSGLTVVPNLVTPKDRGDN
ncbi:rnd efflux pump membrane fusion protein [Lucifera butyrica]|uniref:Rnd efflux pump membrane fusion protein n=1 Tax=Lucifera butyrica TaxID=1351585 RepID=A0A498R552_9FIRM|nr:efflux RND transporter periplasmic adaptor subunit [Lucifera butyrica]VBB05957.1 rnd efflux pump membrane fusion protein [Lucifera butyrica]